MELVAAGVRNRDMDMRAMWSKGALMVATVWVTAAAPSGGLAQSAAGGAEGRPVTFGVASVRRDVSGVQTCDPAHLYVTGDGFHMANCPLIVALFMAYVPADGAAMGFSTDGRVVGAPEWMKSEVYTIDARVDEADLAAWQDLAKRKEMIHTMMRSLLEERCRLVVHREMPEKPEYALVVGKGGPKFQEAKSIEAAAILKEHPGVGGMPGAGGMFRFSGDGSVDFYGAPIATLAVVLSNRVGRPVVDKTGLTGRYDIQLEMPQPGQRADGGQDPGASIFTVVQEELGLRLESAKGKVETLVIDRVERPAEN